MWDKKIFLLFAGSKPRQLEVLAQAKPSVQRHVSVFRGTQDFRDLLEIVNCADNIAIIGGGFLGSELACSLTRRGLMIIVVSWFYGIFILIHRRCDIDNTSIKKLSVNTYVLVMIIMILYCEIILLNTKCKFAATKTSSFTHYS